VHGQGSSNARTPPEGACARRGGAAARSLPRRRRGCVNGERRQAPRGNHGEVVLGAGAHGG
jgi:hypothetical protein